MTGICKDILNVELFSETDFGFFLAGNWSWLSDKILFFF